MSEPMPEQAAQDTGVVEAAATAPQAVEAAGIEAPSIAPDHEAPPKPDPVKPDPIKVEPPKIEASRIEVPKLEAKAEAKPEPKPGKLIVMAPSERSWDREDFAPHVKAEEPRETGSKRRLSAMAAVVAIAASVGAISGALATAGMMHFAAPAQAPVQVADTSALDASVARIDADLVALKANVEHSSKTGVTQFNRANDRLDKLEKAQAEPMAKIAKLSETVDKLRAAPPAAPAQAAAAVPKETTGSIAPTQVATAAAAPAPVAAAPKTEVGRLPTVEGWRLRNAANGGALIEGRDGLYEVYPGDPIPGLGRVDAIRRQDGRWVVVTSKGLIVAR
ncbi:outer membrane murein-binding lipoprotein Lpp [Bradyrhizobium sp. CIR3A]|nr:outer membrane murein-binding lipoprotein Lpp [Bradyrhizobium sp. CIR3A]NYG46470.1 outer membrane murein-binding lipoprotein Lpp [Bradyrhizobium sp. IAR9]